MSKSSRGSGPALAFRGVLFENDHLLAVDKPPGIATHSPDPDLYWGMYEYFHWRNPDLPRLSILHRLDRDTSGVLLFAKSAEAARELGRQWESGEVSKRYLFATRRKPKRDSWKSERAIGGQKACTEFSARGMAGAFHLIEATPKTGRTHQVRIHAAESGVPVVGDHEHGDADDDWPLLLHAAELRCRPPGAGREAVFESPLPGPFSAATAADAWWLRAGLLRERIVPDSEAVRWVHGAADGFAGQAVDRYGDVWVLSNFSDKPSDRLEKLLAGRKLVVKRYLGQGRVENTGQTAPVVLTEDGLRFEIRFEEATTTGLFLDQRENRLRLKRLLAALPPGPVLNCFAHTCSFSVVAASAGRAAASVDLSAKYLEWGNRNFELNGLDPKLHRCLRGDAADWIKRLRKKGEKFAVVILDPPSFSRAKSGDFRVERDLGPLVREAAALVLPGGAMLVATNFQKWSPDTLLSTVRTALHGRKAAIDRLPLPPDFPHHAGEKLWMKSVWVTLDA